MNRLPEAEEKIRALIADNPECRKYYSSLAEALKLKPGLNWLFFTSDNQEQSEQLPFLLIEDSAGLLGLYDSISAVFPKAHTPKRLALNVVTGDSFATRMDTYLGEWLRKGAPSLFANITSLCKTPEKLATIQSLALGYQTSLKATGKLKSSGWLFIFILGKILLFEPFFNTISTCRR